MPGTQKWNGRMGVIITPHLAVPFRFQSIWPFRPFHFLTMKTRGWVFTVNNYNAADVDEVHNLRNDPSVRYYCIGLEVGENGTPHLQGYIEFHCPRATGVSKKYFRNRGRWAPRKGTPKQARDYIADNPDKLHPEFHEWGDMPISQDDARALGTHERWQAAKEGRFEDLAPESIKIYEYIHSKYTQVSARSELDNIWIYGPSGCGKSRYVHTTYPTFYSKGINKWWDGYNHEDVVLVDDLDPRHAEKSGIGYYLKIWGDHYAFNGEVKGGMLKIRPKTVIVTSQYLPSQIFLDFETHDAVIRRFKVKTIVDGELVDYDTTPKFKSP